MLLAIHVNASLVSNLPEILICESGSVVTVSILDIRWCKFSGFKGISRPTLIRFP
jgi:hypothetical protein